MSRHLLVAVSLVAMLCLPAAPLAAQGAGFAPVPLPDPGIAGYRFPEPEPTIPRPLTLPHQFFKSSAPLASATSGQQTVLGFVKYDPTAARHIQDKSLLSKAALQAMLPSKAVPDFPTTAVSLKPVFQVLSRSQLVGGRYFLLADWPGPPSPPKPFPSSDWGRCIWIDVRDLKPGPGSGAVDTACKPDGSSRTPATTYGVGQFVNFRMSPTAVKGLAANPRIQALARAATGDYAVLVAMHVTTREMTQWTWQSFWWSPRAADPPLPSSKAIAAARPPQLKGPAANYAQCLAYSTLFPPQPNTGGQNVGESVYCYNPWLEVSFDPSVLPDSQDGTYQGHVVKNDVGVQTNCMSCHAQANYAPGTVPSPPRYAGDRYVDLNGPAFNGTLKVDFLWSIPGHAR